jgi:SAM-dependent methyltransferase
VYTMDRRVRDQLHCSEWNQSHHRCVCLGMSRRGLLWAGGAVLVAGGSAAWYFRDTRSEEARRLAALLDWKPGKVIGETGAGDGRMTFAASEAAGPGGHVFSTEIDPQKIADIRKKVEARRLKNITVIEAGETSSNLPPGCCDAIFMRAVYHHFTHPEEIDASLLNALRAGGTLAIIDFPPNRFLSLIAPTKGVAANRGGHGIPQSVLIEELTGAGFKLSRVAEDWPGRQYCVLFQKP